MVQQWCREELETADFGDQRLNERVVQVLESLADRPTASIPAALGGRTELEAAYRFFGNDKVTPEKILKPHFHATTKRCRQQRIALCAQDTSELDFTRPQQQVVGAGPLYVSSHRGAFLHMNGAFTEDGTPLGSIGAKIWAREESDSKQPKLSKAARERKRRATPIEEKESIRWIEGIRAVQKLAITCPNTLCVSLSDSEGDMYDLLVEPRTTSNFHWIVRACHDRIVLDSQGNPVGVIRDSLLELPVLFTNDITIQGRKRKIACATDLRRTSRVSRQATVEVRAGTVTVGAPFWQKRAVPFVSVNVVLVREPHPPEGEHPIEWILLTTLPISTMEQVRSVIRYYTVRWMVEIFFRTLKSGCRIEERRFETLPRMLACTAIYMIVAWRTLYVCRLGRSCPDMDCEMIFDPAEWQSVWSVTHRGEPLPPKPPPLSVMVRLIASLGGYVDRPNRLDPPGVETVWKGLQRMRDLAWGWETFGPGAQSAKKDV
jgi:hypothetical protein